MAALAALGGETWFQLGDGDLATHVERTRRLAAGETPVRHHRRLLPPARDCDPHRADDRRPGAHPPAHRRRLARLPGLLRAPALRAGGVGIAPTTARQTPRAASGCARGACATRGLRAVVICPSNPFISIEPILAVPGMREAIAACAAPVVAVSPIIGGRAVKGPTAKMMAELGTAGERRGGGAALRRSARRLCARSCGRRERRPSLAFR